MTSPLGSVIPILKSSVQRRTVELVASDFLRTFDELLYILESCGKTFTQLLFNDPPSRAPRYFQVVFLAFYELIVRQRKIPKDRVGIVALLSGRSRMIPVPEGGRWGSDDRRNSVNGEVGVLSPMFVDNTVIDPATIHWISQLENILTQSYTEQSYYDFKQGFIVLDETNQFDEDNFEKILKTCVGIANIRPGARGYVLVGVADKVSTANRVEALFGISARPFERFFIIGVEHEATTLGKTLEQFFQVIVDKVTNSLVSSDLKGYIARNIKAVRYYDKTIYIFDTQSQQEPSSYDGRYYDRNGAQLVELTGQDIIRLARRFVS